MSSGAIIMPLHRYMKETGVRQLRSIVSPLKWRCFIVIVAVGIISTLSVIIPLVFAKFHFPPFLEDQHLLFRENDSYNLFVDTCPAPLEIVFARKAVGKDNKCIDLYVDPPFPDYGQAEEELEYPTFFIDTRVQCNIAGEESKEGVLQLPMSAPNSNSMNATLMNDPHNMTKMSDSDALMLVNQHSLLQIDIAVNTTFVEVLESNVSSDDCLVENKPQSENDLRERRIRAVQDESVWSIVVEEVPSPVRSHEEEQKSKPLKLKQQLQLHYNTNHEKKQAQQESETFFTIGSNIETFLIPMDVNKDETIMVQNERTFLVSLLRMTKDQQQQRIVMRRFVHLSESAKCNPITSLQLYGALSVEIEIAKEYISCSTDTKRHVFPLGWVRVAFLVLGSMSAIGLLIFVFFTWLESRIEQDEEEEEYDTLPIQYTWQPLLGTSTNVITTHPLPNNGQPTRREDTHISGPRETNRKIAPSAMPRRQISLQQEHSRSHIEEMKGDLHDSPLTSNLHPNHAHTNTANRHTVNRSSQIIHSENQAVLRSQLDPLNQEPQSMMDNTKEVIFPQASKHELHSRDEVDSVPQTTYFDNCRNDDHPIEPQGLPDDAIILSHETRGEESSESNVNIDSQEFLKSQWRLEKEDAPEERTYQYTEDDVESVAKKTSIDMRDGSKEALLRSEESGKLVEKLSDEEDSESIIFPPTCSQPCNPGEYHTEYDASTTSFDSKEEVDANEPEQSPNAIMEERVNLWQDSPVSIGGNTDYSCRVDNIVVGANDGDEEEVDDNTRIRKEHYNRDRQGSVLEKKQQGKTLHDSIRRDTADLKRNESSEDRLKCLERLKKTILSSSQAQSGSKQIAQLKLPPVLKRKNLAFLFDADDEAAVNLSETVLAQDEVLFTDPQKIDSLKEKEITSEESSLSRAVVKQANNNARAKRAKTTVPAPIVPNIVPSDALDCISKEIQSPVWEFGEGMKKTHISTVTGVHMKQQVSCHKSKGSFTSTSSSLHSKKASLGKVDTPKIATGFSSSARKRTISRHHPIESDTKRPKRRKL